MARGLGVTRADRCDGMAERRHDSRRRSPDRRRHRYHRRGGRLACRSRACARWRDAPSTPRCAEIGSAPAMRPRAQPGLHRRCPYPHAQRGLARQGQADQRAVLSGLSGQATATPLPPMLGDIVLAAETVAREAELEGKPLRRPSSPISLCMASCICSAMIMRPTPRPKRWKRWSGASLRGLPFPIPMRNRKRQSTGRR